MTKNHNSLELKKHVGAIHSSGAMSLLQRKIANGLLYNAYSELLEKKEHQISIKDLCFLIGYDSNDRKIIKKALINLLSTVVEWNLIDKNSAEGEGIWNASSIIADASIDGPICTYSYSNRMKQLLYRPEIYGRLNMTVQAKFKSSYGLALYENCIRYQNLDQTPWIVFGVFRKLMGVEDNKYLIFRDFKRRVLDVAVAEVNLHASIKVQPEIKRKTREIISIRFLINRCSSELKSIKTEIQKINVGNAEKHDDLYKKLQNFGVAKYQITEIMNKYGADYITKKIEIIEQSSSFLKGKIINLAGYLIEALEKDFQSPKSSKESIGIHKNEQLTANKRLEDAKLKTAYRNYQVTQIQDNFNELNEMQQSIILKNFELYIGNSLYLKLYMKEGLKNALIAEEFLSFARLKNVSELVGNLLSFSSFCKKQQVKGVEIK